MKKRPSLSKKRSRTQAKLRKVQLAEKNIRVNCVAPGSVWTPLNIADKPAEKAAEHGKATPVERPAQPEEVAPAFVFFASEADSSSSLAKC